MIAAPLPATQFWRLTLIGALSFLAVWTLAVYAGLTSRAFLPAPWDVVDRFAPQTRPEDLVQTIEGLL